MSTAAAAVWLLPPLAPLLLIFAGVWVLTTRPRAGRALIVGGAGILLVLSIPRVGSALVATLEQPYRDPVLEAAEAIVVLGGGSYTGAPEYGQDTVNGSTLERLRYGALLQWRTKKPLLVAGGSPRSATPEAVQMGAVLEQEWNIPVAWRDEASNTTQENARNSYSILSAAGVKRIYLVTHALHMPRAQRAFESAGFTVVPAPTRYAIRHDRDLVDFLPSVDGLLLSSYFCRELLGAIWYRLKPL